MKTAEWYEEDNGTQGVQAEKAASGEGWVYSLRPHTRMGETAQAPAIG